MSDPTIRTIHGALLSFDETHNGRFVLNVLGGQNERHIELTSANMEELIELIGRVYYGAVEEDSEAWMKRLVKDAVAEALAEKDAADKLSEYQKEIAQLSQPVPWYPPFPRPLVTY